MIKFFDVVGQEVLVGDTIYTTVGSNTELVEGSVLDICPKHKQIRVRLHGSKITFDHDFESALSLIKTNDIIEERAELKSDRLNNHIKKGDVVVFSHHSFRGIKFGTMLSGFYVEYENNGAKKDYVSPSHIINISSLRKNKPELFL